MDARGGFAHQVFGAELEQVGTLQELCPHVLSHLEALVEIAHPGAVAVGPSFDGELPAPEAIRAKRSEPAVGIELVVERCFVPHRFGLRSKQDPRGDQIVPVLEDVGADFDFASEQAFDRIPAGIDHRRHALDHQMREAPREDAGLVHRGGAHARRRGCSRTGEVVEV
jgi:hypothetical protein